MDVYQQYLISRAEDLKRDNNAESLDYALVLRELLKYQPDNTALLNDLGVLCYRQGAFHEASALLGKSRGLADRSEIRALLQNIEYPPFPENVILEVSTVCRLKCPLCPTGAGLLNEENTTMSLDAFARIWSQVGPNAGVLTIKGRGEPFLNRDIYAILEHVDDRTTVILETNGHVRLDYQRLLDCGLDEIHFAIDGLDQQMYEEYRREGDFMLAAGNMKALVNTRHQKGRDLPRIGLAYTVLRHNEMYIDQIKRLAGSIGADTIRPEFARFEPPFGREALEKHHPLSPQWRRAQYVDFDHDRVVPIQTLAARHCVVPRNHLVIDVHGNVIPCYWIDRATGASPGNLLEMDLEDIWRSHDLKVFRQSVLKDRFVNHACRYCVFPMNHLGALLEGTEFADPELPLEKRNGQARFYPGEKLYSRPELLNLVEKGRAVEADYIVSLGKVASAPTFGEETPAAPESEPAPGPAAQAAAAPAGNQAKSQSMPAPPAAPEEIEAELNALNGRIRQHLEDERLKEARECLVKSLALKDDQPETRGLLLNVVWAELKRNSVESMENPAAPPTFFNKDRERNPARQGFLKYVPEHLVREKTGLNILYISDIEVAGNLCRFMKAVNHHTTHKARSVILKRDYLGYGEDLVLDTEESLQEARELIGQADFFHFARFVPRIPGVQWKEILTPTNCMVDYYGSDIKNNKQGVMAFHRNTGIFGLNKYDYAQYQGAESLMYHIPTMFDATPYEDREVDLSLFEKSNVVIAHAPTNPPIKYTHYILPIIERVNQRVRQDITTDLIMGVPNAEAMRRKGRCDIFIDCLMPRGVNIAGCTGMNCHESLALGKVTVCSLDDFYMSFFPEAPIFSSYLEDLEDLLVNILTQPDMVRKKMEGAKAWLDQFHPNVILRQFLHLYRFILTENAFVNSFDRFFLEL